MRRQLSALAVAGALGISFVSSAYAQLGNLVFQENFNGLTLGPSVNERQKVDFALNTVVATDPNWQPRPNAFTHTGPAGWTVDNNFDNFGQTDLDNPNYLTGFIVGNTGVPNQGSAENGVDEWEGWSFANKNFWASVDDQSRSSFTSAVGNVAVADSDEYDDLGTGRGGGYMNTGMTTGNINVVAFRGSSINLDLDSSWRAEAYDDAQTTNPALVATAPPNDPLSVNNQTAIIYASFDGGAPDVVDFWDSDSGDPAPPAPMLPRSPSPTFKGDSLNEHITKPISVPAGATNVKLTFAYINAANDWWWAIDNIKLTQGANPAFYSEDFESVTLGPSVNERQALAPTVLKVTAANNDAATVPRPDSFTHTTPAGWNINNSGINPIAIGDNNRGVFEWEGWSFATREFWAFASQGDANSFTKGTGAVAIADSDEFADFGATDAGDPPGTGDVTKPMSTALESPSINIASIGAGQLKLAFDSCWRPEGTAQSAEITVDYGSGPQVVLRWDSDPASPNQHGVDAGGAPNLNESVLVDLNNPAGATTAKVIFKYLNGSNNWFWAIDNIQIGTAAVPEPGCVVLGALAAMGLTVVGRRSRRS